MAHVMKEKETKRRREKEGGETDLVCLAETEFSKCPRFSGSKNWYPSNIRPVKWFLFHIKVAI